MQLCVIGNLGWLLGVDKTEMISVLAVIVEMPIPTDKLGP
jgi:hypothetical protein